MIRLVILAAPLLFVAAPAAAQDAGEAAAVAPAPAAPAVKDRKVCRSSTVTGRRIAQRRCYLASQWAEYDRVQAEAAKKLVNDVQGASAKGNLSGGGSGGLSTGALFGLGGQ